MKFIKRFIGLRFNFSVRLKDEQYAFVMEVMKGTSSCVQKLLHLTAKS